MRHPVLPYRCTLSLLGTAPVDLSAQRHGDTLHGSSDMVLVMTTRHIATLMRTGLRVPWSAC